MSDIDAREPGLAAAILVGGRSRRMGRDKALLRLDENGPTIIETVAQVVASVADAVILVGARDDAYAFLGLPVVDDLIPDSGALGGIHAALTTTQHSHLLVVACDMPFLNGDLLQFMRDLDHDADVLVPVLDRPHPLHAIYAATCLPLIERNLRASNNRVMGWWDAARLRRLSQEEIAQHDPMLRSCFNMNMPDDLAMATRMISTHDG